jgi:hypothetical protein
MNFSVYAVKPLIPKTAPSSSDSIWSKLWEYVFNV